MILPVNPINCAKLGFSAPSTHESQLLYVRRLMIEGYTLNTRQARYIGIHNLHSVVSKLKKKGFPVSVECKPALDPRTQQTSPYRVDYAWVNQWDLEEWTLKQGIKNAPTEAEA